MVLNVAVAVLAKSTRHMAACSRSAFYAAVVLAGPTGRGGMETMVNTFGQKFKVLDPVIGFDSIDVMDMLGSQQWAAKMRLHDSTMFEDPLPVTTDANIALMRQPSTALPKVTTLASKALPKTGPATKAWGLRTHQPCWTKEGYSARFTHARCRSGPHRCLPPPRRTLQNYNIFRGVPGV